MRHVILVVVGVALIASVANMQTKAGTAADEAAIKKNSDMRVTAWNKHDAKGVAATYAADADRVTNRGYFSGRAEVEKSYGDLFATVNKNAALKVDSTKIRFLSADVAVSDRDVTITGRSEGNPTQKNHVTDTYVKRNGEWTLVMSRTVAMQ